MPQPRKSQIAIEATPIYHVVCICVRRAFLCGEDKFTGRSFEHRRVFIESELLRLGQVLFLDVIAYAVVLTSKLHTEGLLVAFTRQMELARYVRGRDSLEAAQNGD